MKVFISFSRHLFQGHPVNRIAVIAILVVLATFSAVGEELVFEQVTGDERVIYRNTITPEGSGYRITLESPGEYNECLLDENLSVLTWYIRRPADGTDLLFERDRNRITASGTRDGRVFNENYRIDNEPWYQFHELSMDRFGVSDATGIRFWTIDRRKMDIVKFKAEKIAEERIEAGGKTWDAVKVELSLTGLAGILGWHSYFWLRASDGRYLRLEAPGFTSSDPDSTVELVEER